MLLKPEITKTEVAAHFDVSGMILNKALERYESKP